MTLGRGGGVNTCSLRVQSEKKTYCAAFYASLALLTELGNNAGCFSRMNGGLIMRYVRISFG